MIEKPRYSPERAGGVDGKRKEFNNLVQQYFIEKNMKVAIIDVVGEDVYGGLKKSLDKLSRSIKKKKIEIDTIDEYITKIEQLSSRLLGLEGSDEGMIAEIEAFNAYVSPEKAATPEPSIDPQDVSPSSETTGESSVPEPKTVDTPKVVTPPSGVEEQRKETSEEVGDTTTTVDPQKQETSKQNTSKQDSAANPTTTETVASPENEPSQPVVKRGIYYSRKTDNNSRIYKVIQISGNNAIVTYTVMDDTYKKEWSQQKPIPIAELQQLFEEKSIAYTSLDEPTKSFGSLEELQKEKDRLAKEKRKQKAQEESKNATKQSSPAERPTDTTAPVETNDTAEAVIPASDHTDTDVSSSTEEAPVSPETTEEPSVPEIKTATPEVVTPPSGAEGQPKETATEAEKKNKSIIDFSPKELEQVLSSTKISEIFTQIIDAQNNDDALEQAKENFKQIFGEENAFDSLAEKMDEWGYTVPEFQKVWQEKIADQIFTTFQSWIQGELRNKVEHESYSFQDQLIDGTKAGFWERAKQSLKKNLPAIGVVVGGTAAVVATGGSVVVAGGVATAAAGLLKRFISRREQKKQDSGTSIAEDREAKIATNRASYKAARMEARAENIQGKLKGILAKIPNIALFGMVAQGIREGSKIENGEEANVLLRKEALLKRAAQETEGADKLEQQLQYMVAVSSARNNEARQKFLKEAANNPAIEALVQKILQELGHTSQGNQADEGKLEAIRQYVVSAIIGGTLGVAFTTESDITRRILSGAMGAGYGYLYGAKQDTEARKQQFIREAEQMLAYLEEQVLAGSERDLYTDHNSDISDQDNNYEQQIRGMIQMGLLDERTDLRLRAEAVMREFDRKEEKEIISNNTLDTVLNLLKAKNENIESFQSQTTTQLLEKKFGWRKWAYGLGGGLLGMLSGEAVSALRERLGISTPGNTVDTPEDIQSEEPAPPEPTPAEVEPIPTEAEPTREPEPIVVEEEPEPLPTVESVTLRRGQGAYHAINGLLRQLSGEDRLQFAEQIAGQHTHWAQRDSNGTITNIDQILNNWREEVVNAAILDDGQGVSLYNPATGRYGVMLHPGAEFTVQYDAKGYPQLHLMGENNGSTFRVVDRPFVLNTNQGNSDVLSRSVNSVDSMSAPEADASMEEGARNQVREFSLDEKNVAREEIMSSGATTDTVPAQAVDTPVTGGQSIEAQISPLTADIGRGEVLDVAAPDTQQPRRIDMPNGRFVQFVYTEDGSLQHTVDMRGTTVTTRMMQGPLADPSQMYQVEGASSIDFSNIRISDNLREMAVYHEAMQTLRNQGEINSPEYRLLQDLYRQRMESVAQIKRMSVQDVFRPEVLRSYGFAVENAPSATVVDTMSSVVPEVTGEDVRLTEEWMERIRTYSGAFTRTERNEIQVYVDDMQRLGTALDAAQGSERERIVAQLRQVQEHMDRLLQTVASRSASS